QELVPARVRGWVDLMINGSFWIGGAIGALRSPVLLDRDIIDPDFGWRLAFLIGAGQACLIFLMRFWIPESPRWLITHGYTGEAKRGIADIDRRFPLLAPAFDLPRVRLRARKSTPLFLVARTIFKQYRRRTLVG